MTAAYPNIYIPAEKLAPRELEVITLTAYGKTRSEIAKALSVSEETVKAYIERARIKLRAVNKTHAATIALTLGLIAPYRIPSDVNRSKKSAYAPPQMGTAQKPKSSISRFGKTEATRPANRKNQKEKGSCVKRCKIKIPCGS